MSHSVEDSSKQLPSLVELEKSVRFDALTGLFYWVSATAQRKAGARADVDNGNRYRRIRVNSKTIKAHRAAWLFVYGQWPTGLIDHIDGNPANNAIANLRQVDHRTNLENQRHARADNAHSKSIGVTWHKQSSKWRARITVAGVQRHIGSFESEAAASAAYLGAKRALHAGCVL